MLCNRTYNLSKVPEPMHHCITNMTVINIKILLFTSKYVTPRPSPWARGQQPASVMQQ
jgi:hypothetical protein